MTKQTIHDVTDDDRRIARDWAEFVKSSPDTWTGSIRVAALVILNDIPAPAPPTLADMTPEERAACRWMQCDVEGEDARAVIFNPYWEGVRAHVMWPGGFFTYPDWGQVTPRPDLARMEWPGNRDGEEVTKVDCVSVAGGRTAYGPWTVARLRKKADTAPALPDGWRLADHEKYGRVVVTNPTPDAEGHVYFVAPAPGTIGNDWHLCKHDELTYIDTGQEADQ